MPKKRCHFRLSESAISGLAKYAQEHNHKNTTEALEQILSDMGHLLSKVVSSSGAPDLLPCNQRRTINNIDYCIIPATLSRGPKTIEIPSPLVCEVCQSIRRNLPSKTLQTQTERALPAPSATTPEESFERNSDPSNVSRKENGQLWCPDGGYWVFPKKCEMCQDKTYPRWYECQKQQLRKKGLSRESRDPDPSIPLLCEGVGSEGAEALNNEARMGRLQAFPHPTQVTSNERVQRAVRSVRV